VEYTKNVSQSRDVTRVISFTSGKGGVGKTHSVVNTAVSLAAQGYSVLILDADLGLANVDVLMGVAPKGTLHDVLSGSRAIDDILVSAPGGVTIIPAASGIEEVRGLSAADKMLLMSEVERIASHYDFLLIDTPAGIGSDVMYFNSAASEVVCVITAEPTSLTDAYALIKVLYSSYGERSFSVLVNDIPSEIEAKATFNRLANAVQKFLGIETRFLGWIESDPRVRDSIIDRSPIALEYPSSRAALTIGEVARSLAQTRPERRVKGGMQFFFEQLLSGRRYGEATIK
jgi:flagellar biosynthesis protein FlhG